MGDFCDAQHNYANFASLPNQVMGCSTNGFSSRDLGKIFKLYGYFWEECITNAAIDISVIDADTGLEVPSSHISLYLDWRLKFFRNVNYNYNIKLKLEHTDTTYGNNFELISPTFNAKVHGCPDCNANVPQPPPGVPDPQQREA